MLKLNSRLKAYNASLDTVQLLCYILIHIPCLLLIILLAFVLPRLIFSSLPDFSASSHACYSSLMFSPHMHTLTFLLLINLQTLHIFLLWCFIWLFTFLHMWVREWSEAYILLNTVMSIHPSLDLFQSGKWLILISHYQIFYMCQVKYVFVLLPHSSNLLILVIFPLSGTATFPTPTG